MFRTDLFTLLFVFIFTPESFAVVQNGKDKAPNPCPPGEHWVRAHTQSAYIRADGTQVAGSNHKSGYQKNPEEDFANNIEYFLFNPKTLKEKSPKVYDWISKKFGDKLKLRSVK